MGGRGLRIFFLIFSGGVEIFQKGLKFFLDELSFFFGGYILKLAFSHDKALPCILQDTPNGSLN